MHVEHMNLYCPDSYFPALANLKTSLHSCSLSPPTSFPVVERCSFHFSILLAGTPPGPTDDLSIVPSSFFNELEPAPPRPATIFLNDDDADEGDSIFTSFAKGRADAARADESVSSRGVPGAPPPPPPPPPPAVTYGDGVSEEVDGRRDDEAPSSAANVDEILRYAVGFLVAKGSLDGS